MKVNQLILNVASNTSMATSTATLYLGNEGATSLATGTITSGSNTFTASNLSGTVNITDGTYQDFTLVFPVSTWFAGTVNGNIGIEVANISYFDTFTDGTTLSHATMFNSYKWDIAPVSTNAVVQ